MSVPQRRTASNSVPHFLIIGACKAGTTTLYDDLASHPEAAMPSEKEPDTLHRARDAVEARQLWLLHFKGAKPGQTLGEASTYYTMMPDYPDVSTLARESLGPAGRIIYLMRHPVRRIESHLAHDHAVGRLKHTDLDQAALGVSRYVDWSDYARQIRPWIEAFGRSNIFPVIFEDFIRHRHEVARAVAAFVGLDPDRLPPRAEVSNARGSQRIMRARWLGNLANSSAYRRHVRPRLPKLMHDLSRYVLTKDTSVPEVALSQATLAELGRRLDHVAPELRALGIEPGSW